MSVILEVIDCGILVTIQDRGRTGYRRIGVPVPGALDLEYLTAANALLGNEPGTAELEVKISGPTLKVVWGEPRIAIIGEIQAKVLCAHGRDFIRDPGSTATLFRGDVIETGKTLGSVSCIGVSGGFTTRPLLGSRSTYQRASIGGVEGGDRLQCGEVTGDPRLEAKNPKVLERDGGPLRVILGPQDDHFTDEAVANFIREPFTVTRNIDRMCMRLNGVRLEHNWRGPEIVSDGVVPGSIQVPADGNPIVLLADCHTSGGYSKIATIIAGDLARLAHVRLGMALRFRSVSVQEASAARSACKARLNSWIADITPFRSPGHVNESARRQSDRRRRVRR